MSLRKSLLGLFGVIAIASLAAAEPPINPLVEGREPNPVVREFHQPEPAPFTYAGGQTAPVLAEDDGYWPGEAVWELLLDQWTVPLAAEQMWD